MDKNSKDIMAPKKTSGGIKDFIFWFIGFVIFEMCLFQPFFIPSGSMIPTLAVGDEIIVEKFAYGISGYSWPLPGPQPGYVGGYFWSKPAIGDVVVFRNTQNINEDYIKRVVGLPGDTVQIKGGVLYVNDKKMERVQVPDISDMNKKDYGMGVHPDVFYKENLNGVMHYVEQDGLSGWQNDTIKYVVPPDMFFAMGDNRNHSADSRFQNLLGYVPLKNIVGKAVTVGVSARPGQGVFSIVTWPFRIRWDRFFSPMSL